MFVGLALPAPALAGPCGLPDAHPIWIDYGVPELASVFVRPGTALAVSTGQYPAQARAGGSATIYWDMNLNNRVGTPTAPANPALMDERAHRLFVFAASQTACSTPWIVLNELFGAHLETPWSPANEQYRANVLALMRGLAARGARPFLLLSRAPYTGGEAADWWRAVAEVGDIVPEVYPSARVLWTQGPILANRRLRTAYRRGVAQLTSIGVPVSKIGLILGFQSRPGTGGRDGLRPRDAWFEVVKWQALAVRQVAAEMKIPHIFSWGWGTYSVEGRDPDKAAAACVWLWTRNPNLCDALAVVGKSFSPSRTQGQLNLPNGVICRVGRNSIRSTAVARLNVVTGDRDVAFTALFSRLAESRRVAIGARQILAAERAIVSARFGGSYAAYRAALARARANVEIARGVIGDQLRRRKAAAGLRVPRPTATAIAEFYANYGDVTSRTVAVERPAWWLGGRRSGLALGPVAPSKLFAARVGARMTVRTAAGTYVVRVVGETRPLATVPLSEARAAIAATLTHFARSDAVLRWSASQQNATLNETTCRRDDLPAPADVDLTAFLPFLALEG